jgi:hypothetical protein
LPENESKAELVPLNEAKVNTSGILIFDGEAIRVFPVVNYIHLINHLPLEWKISLIEAYIYQGVVVHTISRDIPTVVGLSGVCVRTLRNSTFFIPEATIIHRNVRIQPMDVSK